MPEPGSGPMAGLGEGTPGPDESERGAVVGSLTRWCGSGGRTRSRMASDGPGFRGAESQQYHNH